MRNASGALEYQYAIADHQGNTRVVFSSVNPSETHLATFENMTADAQKFKGLTTNTQYWVNAPSAANNTPGGQYSLRMNSTYNATGNAPGIAAAKSLSVAPGDVINMEVYAYYMGASGFGSTSKPIATLIASVASLVTTGMATAEASAATSGINTAYTSFGGPANQSDAAPSAYLNYILLDKNYKLLDMGWQAVPTTANGAKQLVSFTPRTIKEPGYMYVYLSYEGDGTNWVYFDDLKITHTKSNVVQYNEYYPLGLQASTSWTRENSSNNFLYNEGSELNQTTGWYETAFRNYDAALGRLTSIDPMASKYASFSGYHYAYNNPVMSNDPSGADAESDAQTQAQTQFNYMLEMEKLRRELEDKQWADFLASNPSYDGPRDLGLVAQYYGMQAEAAQQKEAALLAAARGGDINAIREYAAMQGGLIRYEGAAAQELFNGLNTIEEVRVAQQEIQEQFQDLINNSKYAEAVNLVINAYSLDDNAKDLYSVSIVNDNKADYFTTGGDWGGKQTIYITTGVLTRCSFGVIVRSVYHELIHVNQRAVLEMADTNEREFLAYYNGSLNAPWYFPAADQPNINLWTSKAIYYYNNFSPENQIKYLSNYINLTLH